MSEIHFFFAKWPPTAIWDARNSFSFAFLVNSDEKATMGKLHLNVDERIYEPIWEIRCL